MTETHTPLPWEAQVLETENDPGVYIVGTNLGGLVGAALPWPTEIESGDYSRVEANAAFIVHAVNSHHRLVEALEALVLHCASLELAAEFCGESISLRLARAALKEVGR